MSRMSDSTPKFFRVLRNIGLMLAAAGAAVISSADILPPLVIQIAGYATVAGSVMGAVSQAAVKNEQE